MVGYVLLNATKLATNRAPVARMVGGGPVVREGSPARSSRCAEQSRHLVPGWSGCEAGFRRGNGVVSQGRGARICAGAVQPGENVPEGAGVSRRPRGGEEVVHPGSECRVPAGEEGPGCHVKDGVGKRLYVPSLSCKCIQPLYCYRGK
jgi:hypothetical protein